MKYELKEKLLLGGIGYENGRKKGILKMKESSKIIKYPHFIQSKPCGIDKFDGQSQKRLTEAIANYIISSDNENNPYALSRIIGLEGNWGSGKSNVIIQLKEFLKEKYYFFEYDTWGNQEELQRRAFIELITDKLINDNILKKEKWEEKLNDLLAKRVVRLNKKSPKFSVGALFAILALVLTPITKFIAEHLEKDKIIKNIWLITGISFGFIILSIIIWLILMIFFKNMRNIGFLLQISKNENTETENHETINEDEPTVRKFKAWMKEISDHIGNNKKTKKLIVVFDNMDRLSAEKVKEVWSSIHTFFSEEGFENIWAIIPFDEKHLSCAFGETEKSIMLTKHFISKTFPIVYRVTPPVITDFKNIFNTFFEDAFEKTESENQEDINRIFRLENPTATIRDIIIFINHLVALKSIWKNEINILPMAIFVIKKDIILDKPVDMILSGDYLDEKIIKIITNYDDLQKNISALVYGILPDEAEQIPISKYIEDCLNLDKKYNINKYITHKHFLPVLEDKINNSDIPLDTLITVLSQLSTEFENQNKNNMLRLWDNIAKRKIQEPLEKQIFDNIYKILLSHSSKNYQQNIIRFLCNQFQLFKDFNGELYYDAINTLDVFLDQNNIENNIENYINEVEKSPAIFVSYVVASETNYKKYKIKTNSKQLDDYISNLIPDSLIETEFFNFLINDETYNFELTFQKIQDTIKQDTQGTIINANNFKTILDTYKLLSKKKPLPVQLNTNQRTNIWNNLVSKTTTIEYLEIVTIQIANFVNVTGTFNEKQIKIIAENIEYYANYGNLLNNCINSNITLLNQVLNYLTKNSVGTSRMTIKEILPLFDQIKERIQVTEQELLIKLNGWSESAKEITKDEIQTLIQSPHFFLNSINIKNELTEHLNKIVIEALCEVPCDSLYQKKGKPTDYWMNIIKYFIETDYIKVLPDNLTEFGKKILTDIAAGNENFPISEVFQKIIDKLDKKKTAAHIKDIRNEFCNGIYTMNTQIFIFFESWFKEQGDLFSRSAEVVHNIIEPVISDTDCLNIIISKSDYYSKIINKAGDDATDIKSKIEKIFETNKEAKFIEFARKIGLELK